MKRKMITVFVAVAMLMSLSLAALAAWTLRDSGNATETLVYNPALLDCPTGQTVWLLYSSNGFGPFDSTGSVTMSATSGGGASKSATFSGEFDGSSTANKTRSWNTGYNNIGYASANPAGLSSVGDTWLYTQCF